MTTNAGKQDNFVDAIKNLIELEHDIKELYDQAINKSVSDNYKIKLNEFSQDHAHHIEKISELLTNRKEQIPIMSGFVRPLINTIKVEFANLVGDQAELSNIISNEKDIHKVYERMNARHDRWDEAKELLKQALQDQKKHMAWLEETIKSLN
jgi:rubrerythrin